MKILGVVLVVLALALAVVPQFTTCDSQGKALTTADGRSVPMKCLWTARGEIALAVPLIGVGVMMTISRRKETLRNLSVMGIILGIFAIALPTVLIGVCATPTMYCVTAEKPAILSLGALTILGSIGGIVLAQRKKETGL